MTSRCSVQELGLVVLALVMAFWLRAAHTEQLAVEHFDEGIYSSGTWYDGIFGAPYPARHLYAPPLLPTMIDSLAAVPSLNDQAPFIPAIVLGFLTVVAVWWVARSFFGQAAGLFVVFVAAFSDFHILFSRMALTDAPVLFWICLSVGLAVTAIARQSFKLMVVAGIVCGIAWWTKYSGWLPVAIVVSGSAFWWLLEGRKQISAVTMLKLWAAMAITAFVVWSPWLWMLQDRGGYQAVRDNHGGYWMGVEGWQQRLADHITYYFTLEGWFGAVAVGVGLLAAGTRRWIELKRSTWNSDSQTRLSHDSAAAPFPSNSALARFVVGAIVLFVLGSAVGTVGLLTCIGVGGLAGMFLWPVNAELHRRSSANDPSPPVEGGSGFFASDFSSAATVDPLLGTSVVLAWFCGMLLTTPMYAPYPRLSLPLLASIWLASAAGISWWIEAIINVERRGEDMMVTRRGRVLRQLTFVLVGGAIGLAYLRVGNVNESAIWRPRTSLRDVSWQIGQTVLDDIDGTFVPPEFSRNLDENGLILPGPPEPDSDAGEDTNGAESTLAQQIAPVADRSEPIADIQNPECVVYAFGEPAVLKHLNEAGLLCGPVQDFAISPLAVKGDILPTYLIFGPNALRTPDMFNKWAKDSWRFEPVTEFHFVVSDIVAYNLFAPLWVAQHPECRVQKIELYRVLPLEN